MKNKIETIKYELQKLPIVENASYGSHIPYTVFSNGWGLEWEGKDPNYNPLITYPMVDADFKETFKISLLDGRFFNKENPSADSTCVVINEKFAKIISKESVVDKIFRNGDSKYRIIGVVKNYHCTPNTRRLEPILLRLCNNPNYLFVKYTEGNSIKTIKEIEKICSIHSPSFPLIYQFMDDHYDKMYESNRSTISTLFYASILAIIISCLGLFGLASFTAEEKTKEIGVRKVLGASLQQLILIFSKDFSKWIVLASLISWPVTYFAMERWFENYPYRIDFPYWLFIVVFILLFLISTFTVIYQSWKSASQDPVKSLKCE